MLTARELLILNYIARGCSNKQIADQLDVSWQTVKNHVTNVLRKMGVQDRTMAALVAIREGLVEVEGIRSQKVLNFENILTRYSNGFGHTHYFVDKDPLCGRAPIRFDQWKKTVSQVTCPRCLEAFRCLTTPVALVCDDIFPDEENK